MKYESQKTFQDIKLVREIQRRMKTSKKTVEQQQSKSTDSQKVTEAEGSEQNQLTFDAKSNQ